MPRNSQDGSYNRFVEMETLAKVYYSRAKFKSNLKTVPKERIKEKELLIEKIERTCNALCEPYKSIVKNTFFEKKNLYWWEGVYPKTTYYRLRNKAIQTFLLVYNIQ